MAGRTGDKKIAYMGYEKRGYMTHKTPGYIAIEKAGNMGNKTHGYIRFNNCRYVSAMWTKSADLHKRQV